MAPETENAGKGGNATENENSDRSLRRALTITAVALLGPFCAIALGVYIYLAGGRTVSTDNAYVKSDKIAVSTDVSGRVISVAVRADQDVRAGDLLFRIDPVPLKIAFDQANAQLASARQAITALKANYLQKKANITRAEGEVSYFKAQAARQQKLASKRIVSQTALDTVMNQLRDARDKLAITRQDIEEVKAKLGGAPDAPVDDHPRVLESRALRDRAQLDLVRTEIRSPVDGTITNFDLQKGEYVKAGEVVFSLVGSKDIWVQANYKETELTHVRVGQTATVSVDAYPGEPRQAIVASISPATGAEFALLPPQNATGNWVKVVQRLTVRLRLKEPFEKPKLRAGMSVIATIDTGHQRKLTGLLAAVFGWIGTAEADVVK